MTEPNRPESHDSWLNQPAEPDLWAQPATKNETTGPGASSSGGWEREVLEKLVLATVAEQRAARRWRIFWRLLWLAILGAVVWAVSTRDLTGVAKSSPHTAVIDIKGEIGADAQTSADAVVASLRSAFEDSGAKAVVDIADNPAAATKGDLDAAVQNIKGQIDALSNSQQMDMLRLQSLSNKRNEAFETMTNFIKKMQDNRNSIIGNMR